MKKSHWTEGGKEWLHSKLVRTHTKKKDYGGGKSEIITQNASRGKNYEKEVKRYLIWAPEGQNRGKVGKSVWRDNNISSNWWKLSEQVNAKKSHWDTV